MGTDIHMVVQVRDGKTWKRSTATMPCTWCEGTGKSRRTHEECYFCNGKKARPLTFDDRSYYTFAILADVRNGHGFAGVDTGDGFIPIAEQRGVPEDFEVIDYELGDHSFSWLTLRELLVYPHWERLSTLRGEVSLEEFAKWDSSGRGQPSTWCGGMSGPNVYVVSNEAARELIKCGLPEQAAAHAQNAKRFNWYHFHAAHFQTVVEWKLPYKECAKEFHDNFIPALCKLGSPDDVRIVFGFDS